MTLFTLTIFLMSIWSLTIYATRMLRQDLQQMVSNQLSSTVSSMAEEINQELENRIKSLEDIAEYISPALQDNPADLQKLLEQRTTFQSLFNSGTYVAGIDGIAVADVPISTGRIGINFMDSDLIRTVFAGGKSTIGKPVMGKKLLAPVLAIGTPICNMHGKVIGVLVGVTDLSKPNFLDKVAENKYGKTGGYLLIAPQHKLFITGTDKNYIMKPVPGSGVNALFDRYMEGFEGAGIVVDAQGAEVLSSAKQIPVAGWFLVARIPTAEAFQPVDIMQLRILLVTLFMTLLAG